MSTKKETHVSELSGTEANVQNSNRSHKLVWIYAFAASATKRALTLLFLTALGLPPSNAQERQVWKTKLNLSVWTNSIGGPGADNLSYYTIFVGDKQISQGVTELELPVGQSTRFEVILTTDPQGLYSYAEWYFGNGPSNEETRYVRIAETKYVENDKFIAAGAWPVGSVAAGGTAFYNHQLYENIGEQWRPNGFRFQIIPKIPVITFHRVVDPMQVSNPNPSADGLLGKDDPLKPVPDSDTLHGLANFDGGLVADGATPWVIKVKDELTTETIACSITKIEGGSLLKAPRIFGLDGAGWSDSPARKIEPGNEAYFYMEAISPGDIKFDEGKTELLLTVSIGRDNSISRKFKVRKPPVMLVHGINTDHTSWEGEFPAAFATLVPEDFVRPIKYGTGDTILGGLPGMSLLYPNTQFPLETLVKELNDVLNTEVTTLRQSWAFCRYDVVGHSQGGVLTRMLCAKAKFEGTDSFRNDANFNRGRFRRIVTIGSPHNGSLMVSWIIKLRRSEGDAVRKAIFNNELVKLLAVPKFDAFGDQIKNINSKLRSPDEGAMFHCLGTTINRGEPPSAATEQPRIYSLTALSLPIAGGGGRTIGQTLLPLGSDGIVDLVSQIGGVFGGSNKESIFRPPDLSHSPPASAFGVSSDGLQTKSAVLGRRVAELLGGTADEFRKFTNPDPLLPEISITLDNLVPTAIEGGVVSVKGGSGAASRYARQFSKSQQTSQITGGPIQISLAPIPTEPAVGPIVWCAWAYGPKGVSFDGIDVAVGDTNPYDAKIVVDDSVFGDVIVQGIYTSATKLVVGTPVLVFSKPVDANLVGLELQTNPLAMTMGDTDEVQVWGLYGNGVKSRMFIDPQKQFQFVSSDTSIVEVSPDGSLNAMAEGEANVTVTLNGLADTRKVSVIRGEAGTLQFGAPEYLVTEGAGEALVTVRRSGGTAGSVSVHFATSSGSALPGLDYTEVSGELVFKHGENIMGFRVPMISDPSFELSEGVNLTLSNPLGGVTLGAQDHALLVIQNDDPFTSGKANYAATFGGEPSSSVKGGHLRLSGLASGRFTGSLAFDGKTYQLKGVLDEQGHALVAIPRRGSEPLMLELQSIYGLDLFKGAIRDGATTIPLEIVRSAIYSANHPTSRTGNYTVLFDSTLVQNSGKRS